MALIPRGNGVQSSRSSAFQIYRLLLNKLDNMNIIANNTGNITVNAQALEDLTTAQNQLITNLKGVVDRESWDKIAGNSIQYSYYTGVAAGNPSGNENNLKSIIHKTGATTVFTITYSYDINNRVIGSVTT